MVTYGLEQPSKYLCGFSLLRAPSVRFILTQCVTPPAFPFNLTYFVPRLSDDFVACQFR